MYFAPRYKITVLVIKSSYESSMSMALILYSRGQDFPLEVGELSDLGMVYYCTIIDSLLVSIYD
jgi:hypothetical protein